MAYPNTNPIRQSFAGGWESPEDPAISAHLWRCERDGQAMYFRADVWRHGQTVASFTAPTLERLKAELEKKYGGTGDE